MIGSRLGSYELEEEIGRGGMGIVYRASQPALGRQVAVKVLLPHLARDAEFVERFLREARAAAKLEHPGLVTIFDVGDVDGTYYFSMQWLQGKTLEELLEERGPLPVAAAVDYVRQVAAALGYAHNAGVVHRDVKPANVILDHTGRAVLTDFGIARASTDTRLTRVGAAVGSPDYMAPEQINGEAVDARTDLYSLGVLFHHLLTGEQPYTGEAPIAVAYQHLNAPVPSARETRPEVPVALDAIVRRLMAKKPEERFQSADELLRELAPIEPQSGDLPLITAPAIPVAGPPAPTPQPAPAEEAPAPPRRLPAAAWIAGVVVLAVIVTLGWRWIGSGTPEVVEAPAGPAAPPAAERLELAFEVSPDLPELEIWVDGEDRGLRTPATVELAGLAGQSVAVELRRDGEVLASRQLELGPQMERSWSPSLAPPPESLTVTSEPPGARVTLDSEPVEGTTPVTVELVPGRRYELGLRLDGHDPAGLSFRLEELSADQRQSGVLHFPLAASIPPGELVVVADYPVSVAAGGRRARGSGEVRLALPPGSYDVRLEAPEVFYAANERVTLESGGSRTLRLPGKVAVTVSANPSYCRVRVDGRDIGYVPIDVELALGPHEFSFDWEKLGKTMTVTRQIGLATRSVHVPAPE